MLGLTTHDRVNPCTYIMCLLVFFWKVEEERQSARAMATKLKEKSTIAPPPPHRFGSGLAALREF